MEKPVCPDGSSGRRLLELNKKVKAKNLKVGVGLMYRHCDARGELFKRVRDGEGQPAPRHPDLVWAFPQDPREPDPYDREWEHLIDALRNDTEYNEVDRGVQASLVTTMGRMAAHTGQLITYDQVLNREHEMSPNTNQLTLDSDSPLMPKADGTYPVPEPGSKTDRES